MSDFWAAEPVGSSPLARGLHRRRCPHPVGTGIIPARAGFTEPGDRRRRRPADHPRSRGVYSPVAVALRVMVGSSPLARGLRDRPDPRRRGEGIIPARAGFTRRSARPPPPGRDHPRSRGVYPRPRHAGHAAQGSSPLARGLLYGIAGLNGDPGIIPARAGFTPPARPRRVHRPDHPRSRGVYSTRPSPSTATTGSSPLARGLRRRRHGHHGRARIIPARAGFTPRHPAAPATQPDHPRSRGVYPRSSTTRGRSPGSSPLARGLLRE